MLDKDTLCSRSGFFIVHSLCPSLALGHFHEAMEALLHISWLTLVFTSAQHPPLSSWMCWMVAALSESLWYRTQQGSDSITLSKQTANMSPACYHFSLIVMSEPLKATPLNDEGAPAPSYVRLSVAAHFGTEGKRMNLSTFAVLVSSCTFHRGHKGLLPVYHHAGLSCSWGLTKPLQAARRIRYERITDIHPAAKILEDSKRVWHS